MSEKRISIKEFAVPCDNCRGRGAGENVCEKCPVLARWQSFASREQAIERMAAALQSVAVDRGGIDLDDDTTLDPRMLAEAALDALLGGNNGN